MHLSTFHEKYVCRLYLNCERFLTSLPSNRNDFYKALGPGVFDERGRLRDYIFVRSLACSVVGLIGWSVRSFDWLVCSCVHTFVRSYVHSFIPLLLHSLVCSFVH